MKFILLLLTCFATVSFASVKGNTYHLPAIDVVAEKNKASVDKSNPLKYAVNTPVNDLYYLKGKGNGGQWKQLNNGRWEYQIRIHSKNAVSLNVGLTDLFLPHSAELWVYTDNKDTMRGPYNDTFNQSHGYFWVGDVPADHLNLKITVSEKERKYLSFNVNNVTRGFYKYWQQPSYLNKSGSCNLDVVCSESEGWEAEISSVGRYTFSTPEGGFLCTGQLINNTAQDGKPIFSTADHCGYSTNSGQRPLNERQNVAASISVTWNYQSSTCRTPGSSQSGTQISTNGFNDVQSGATYLASNPDSDFALVELNSVPNVSYGIEYTGWDRSDAVPDSAVGIHHPSGHAKRISFENDPITVTALGSTAQGNGAFLRVGDWDIGTTEGGSSGSGLWNSNKLFVGQLQGGFAACGNNEPDWYGRMNFSWDQGSDAQSRMKDWLDPLDTGQEILQGSAGCEAPTVSITNNSSNEVGDLLTFSSQVSGGSGGYSYQWDINEDGQTNGSGSSIQARYNQQFVGNIKLTVKDSDGCQTVASQAVVIEAPAVELQQVVNIRENLDQLCGNNDSVIDPGERWTTLINPKNVGNQTAIDAFVALGVARSSSSSSVDSDDYGNTVNSCDRLFIDITGTGTLMPWNSAGTQYDADDEGFTSIQLSQAFDHYGSNVSTLVASTNGYLSTSSNALGDDWDNDCPLPQSPNRDQNGARIAPMHSDLKASAFYHQFFNSCPRPADTGGDLACEVFLWKNADLWDTTNVTESIDIQAILYPATSQWVYQFDGSGFDGSGSTSGMQNTAGNDGLTYACNMANSIDTNEAICTFNKNHQLNSSGAEFVKLETPVISLGNMSVNEDQTHNLDFAIAEDASCGTSFAINHEASVFTEGFNAGEANIFSGTIGQNGQCNVVTSCGVSNNSNDINPKDGLWWNPLRSGNGVDLHVTGQQALLYVMYTGNPNRTPAWYIANNADTSFNQYYNDILMVNYPGGYGSGNQELSTVGWSNTSFINATEAIQVRNINGYLSAEKIVLDQFAADPTPNMHTGHYFAQSESGWGQSVITIGGTRVVISYIYDQQGNPFWTIGSGPNDNTERSVVTADTFCPHCPSVPLDVFNVGNMRMSFDGQTSGTIEQYNISYPGQPQAEWSRSNLPIVNVVPADN